MTNIKKARLAMELSQKEVAVSLKVAQPTVSAWESGDKFPSAKNLKRLASLLNTTVDELLGNTDDPTPPGKKNTASEETVISDEDLKFALWGHADIDDAKLKTIRKFAKMLEDEEDEDNEEPT